MLLYVGGDSVCDCRFLENSKFGAVCHLYEIYGIVDTHPERAINLSIIHCTHFCGIKQYRGIELRILGYATRIRKTQNIEIVFKESQYMFL